MTTLLDVLRERGMLHDATPGLAERLAAGPIAAYAGFDPTADSLHIGNLIPVMALAWLQRLGGKPIVLIGGGTGAIGDPSGRQAERQLLSLDVIGTNAKAIAAQLSTFFTFGDGATDAVMVNNADWLDPLHLLDFLRDTGKHFTVNYMLQKDSVKSRMDGGISFAEFSYMLIMAYDFAHLAATRDCELQLGGSDQWGNITAGIELAARRDHRKLHGAAMPLLTTASGAKFGKSESGNVWLDPARTSPYAFHQFWLRVDDADVDKLLRFMTFLPLDEIAAIMAAHAGDPGKREAQRRLADDITARVHGAAAVRRAGDAAAILFGGGDVRAADAATLAMVAAEVPSFPVSRQEIIAGIDLLDALDRSGLAASKGEARRGVAAGGYSVNGSVESATRSIAEPDLLPGGYVLLRRGKKHWAVLVSQE